MRFLHSRQCTKQTVRWFIALAAIACASACARGDEEGWASDFDIGEYPVGFRSIQMTSAPFDGRPSRRMTLSVWYPASNGDLQEPVRVEDLFRLAIDEGQLLETDGLSIERGFAAAMTGDSTSIPINRLRAALDAPTSATHDPTPASGPFPLALWSARHATVIAQAPMAETLASHGMVVATVWSSDPPLAFLWEDRSAADKLATITAHTNDLLHALTVLRSETFVDGERVIVLSWSYGGQTAARLQERDDAVRAVISLDANVLPARPEELIALRRPLVYFVGEATASRGFERLGQLETSWIGIGLPELAHGNFNALEGYLPGLYEADTVFAWSHGGKKARTGYQALVRMVTAAAITFTAESEPSVTELARRLSVTAGSITAQIRYSGDGR